MGTEYRTILVTGASGFIGSRLVPALAAAGYPVRCLVRHRTAALPSGVETVAGDMLDRQSLSRALRDVDTAYYLVHSLAGGRSLFAERDRLAARNFVSAAHASGLRRTIYLGGLGEAGSDRLSEHLSSRQEVAAILAGGRFATTILQAAVIIGAGGASFEVIRSLVERLPVMVTPRWVSTRCQPIAVGDVIRYLVGCLQDERTAGGSFHIGGPEILSYRQMMDRFARLTGRTRVIIPVPFLTPHLSSYWVALFSSVDSSISTALIEGVRNEVICREDRIRSLIPFPLTSYDDAVKIALAEEPVSA